jgi:hypothetical protein
MTAEPTMPWSEAPPPLASELAALETRVQHLEAAVAPLQDIQTFEDRIVERVAARLPHGSDSQTAANLMAAAGSALRTMAAPVGQTALRAPWLAVDLYQEIVAIARMFFDLNYKVGWLTRLLVLILVPAILTSHWWLPFANVWLVGELLDKLVDLALAFVVFKALSREAQRYREFRASQGRW